MYWIHRTIINSTSCIYLIECQRNAYVCSLFPGSCMRSCLTVSRRKLPFRKFALNDLTSLPSRSASIQNGIRSEKLLIALKSDHPEIIFASETPTSTALSFFKVHRLRCREESCVFSKHPRMLFTKRYFTRLHAFPYATINYVDIHEAQLIVENNSKTA